VDDMLAFAQSSPVRTLVSGETLIVDGQPVSALYVLIEGALRIEKAGTPVALLREPGNCVGEMSLLLGANATADVVAAEVSVVAEITDARARLEGGDGLSLALARLLASRLQIMTSFLADLRHQYGDHEGGLGMVDIVLDSLMRGSPTTTRLVSERDPDPEY
jgi:CRP-like cAMP-binding protein